MTTHDIALQLAHYVSQGQFAEARQALYAPNAQSQEADGTQCQGLAELDVKQAGWQSALQQVYHVEVGAPLVNGNVFSLAFTWDLQYKGQARHIWREVGTFLVQDGRIVREQFLS